MIASETVVLKWFQLSHPMGGVWASCARAPGEHRPSIRTTIQEKGTALRSQSSSLPSKERGFISLPFRISRQPAGCRPRHHCCPACPLSNPSPYRNSFDFGSGNHCTPILPAPTWFVLVLVDVRRHPNQHLKQSAS